MKIEELYAMSDSDLKKLAEDLKKVQNARLSNKKNKSDLSIGERIFKCIYVYDDFNEYLQHFYEDGGECEDASFKFKVVEKIEKSIITILDYTLGNFEVRLHHKGIKKNLRSFKEIDIDLYDSYKRMLYDIVELVRLYALTDRHQMIFDNGLVLLSQEEAENEIPEPSVIYYERDKGEPNADDN